jgi:energy-coupling factor transport system permease protein
MRYLPHPIPMFFFLIFICTAGFALNAENRITLTTAILLIYILIPNGGTAILSILKFSVPLCIVIGLFMIFIFPETETWLIFGPLKISYEGMITAVDMISRIMILFTGIIGFFTLLPLQRLGSYLFQKNLPLWLVFIIVNGLKLMDRFRQKLQEIHFYQRLRGMPHRGVIRRWGSTLKVMIPLLYLLIEESSNRAVALEMRGFTSDTPRTAINPDNQTVADQVLSIGLIIGTVVTLLTGIL